MKTVRILGDVHGNYEAMCKVIAIGDKKLDYILQLGDLGFDYRPLDLFKPINAVERRRIFNFIPGNHDNYDTCLSRPECLGNYGKVYFIPNSFFVRGGFSIDVKYRTPGLDWWDKEELSLAELDKAVEEYGKIKPKYMFSHECPFSLVPEISDGKTTVRFGWPAILSTRTNLALEKMLQIHRPDFWFFGHFHSNFDRVIDGTRFICLTSDGRDYIKQTHFDLEV